MRIGVLGAASSAHTVKIANGLASLGHEVTLFSLPGHRDADNALRPDVPLVYFDRGGAAGYLLNAAALRRALSGAKAEVLSAHFASGYGTLAALSGFHPYALSVWGSDVYQFPLKSPLHAALLRRNLKKADALFSTGHIMAKKVSRYAPARPVEVTPFGVDTAAFSPAPGRGGRGSLRIGFFKALKHIYAPQDVIDAFALLVSSAKAPAAELCIYGDGPLRGELERRVLRLGLQGRVHFFGRIPHSRVPEAMNGCDIFCAPSYAESFGVAALEAMAAGLPCVTSDADGFREIIEDGVTGYIVPRGDVRALAGRLAALAEDEMLRLRIGRAGRARVVEHYDWAENVKILARALERAAERGAS